MNAGSLLNEAHKAEREGDKTKAEKLYNQVIQEFPESKEAASARVDLLEVDPTAGSTANLQPSPTSSTVSANSASGHRSLVVKSDYKTTRVVVFFVSIIAWIIVVAGLAMLLSAGVILINSIGSVENEVAQFAISRFAVGPAAGGGIALLVVGLTLVMFSQMTRATLDSADYARESLLLAKQRARLSN